MTFYSLDKRGQEIFRDAKLTDVRRMILNLTNGKRSKRTLQRYGFVVWAFYMDDRRDVGSRIDPFMNHDQIRARLRAVK